MLAAFSCDFSDLGAWTEWHVIHERLRASWMLPFHCVWLPRVWQVRQVAETSRGFICVKRLIEPGTDGSSRCALPGPWQLSHPFSASGEPGICFFPCAVW